MPKGKLWLLLRARQLRGVKFRRQQPLGPYIVDFCSLDPKLVIEVDGGQHAEEIERDAIRTGALEQMGYRVKRFWNNDVLQEHRRCLRADRRGYRRPQVARADLMRCAYGEYLIPSPSLSRVGEEADSHYANPREVAPLGRMSNL
jgi:very-short-patch-repair endonuclease